MVVEVVEVVEVVLFELAVGPEVVSQLGQEIPERLEILETPGKRRVSVVLAVEAVAAGSEGSPERGEWQSDWWETQGSTC